MKSIRVGKYLVVDPRVCHGKMTFKGTRVPVETVLYFLSTGRPIEEILAGWPYLKREAIEEAIRLAAVAWPELMRRDRAKGIERLAASLEKQSKATTTHEPAHSGRTA